MKIEDVTVTFEETGDTPEEWMEGTRSYDAEVSYTAMGKTVTGTFPYHQGPGITTEPEPRDLLDCLAMDANMGAQHFEDFCADLGYDSDSRKAYALWQTLQTQRAALEEVFGTHLDEFTETDWSEV